MYSSLSISPFKLTSVEEVEEVELGDDSTSSGTLMPSANIQLTSHKEETSIDVPGFKEWQEKETKRCSVLKARSRSTSQCAFCFFFLFLFHFLTYSFCQSFPIDALKPKWIAVGPQ